MNYSLYHDILPSPSKQLFQKDFYIKEEINSNNEILTKPKVKILDDMSVDDSSEKAIMRRFISTVTKKITNPNSKDVSNLIEAYPSIEENIVKAASILFFSIGHSSIFHNNSNKRMTFDENIEDNDSYFDDGSDSDSSCNSDTECYYCGYYPMRNGLKKQKLKFGKINNNNININNNNNNIGNNRFCKKTMNNVVNNRRKTLNFDYYESLKKNGDPLCCIKDDLMANIDHGLKKEKDNMMIDNEIYINNDDMNIDNDLEDEDQMKNNSSRKKKRNIRIRKDLKMNDTNTTMNNNKFNLLSQNSTFNNTLFFSNQTIKPNSSTPNNLTNNDLMIPSTMNTNSTTNSLKFSSTLIKNMDNSSPTTSLLNNIKDNLSSKNHNKTSSTNSSSSSTTTSSSKSSKQSNSKNKGEKITPHDLINGIRFFHLQPSNDPNARKYLCSFPGCTSAFQRKYNCRSHYSSVHLQLRPYHCDCGINFTRKYDLYRHDSMVHRRGPMVKNFNNKNKNSNNNKSNKNNNKTGNNNNNANNNLKSSNNNKNEGSLNLIPSSMTSDSLNSTMNEELSIDKNYTINTVNTIYRT